MKRREFMTGAAIAAMAAAKGALAASSPQLELASSQQIGYRHSYQRRWSLRPGLKSEAHHWNARYLAGTLETGSSTFKI